MGRLKPQLGLGGIVEVADCEAGHGQILARNAVSNINASGVVRDGRLQWGAFPTARSCCRFLMIWLSPKPGMCLINAAHVHRRCCLIPRHNYQDQAESM
jgi:hypothetical protein